MVFGFIVAYSSLRVCWCAARSSATAHCVTRSLGARSDPRRSGALATLWPALERLFASPCLPTDNLPCAGRLSKAYATTWARRPPASAPETARRALRCARLALAAPSGVLQRNGRVAARERVVRGFGRRAWRLSISTARGASDGVRRAGIVRRGGAHGLAARAETVNVRGSSPLLNRDCREIYVGYVRVTLCFFDVDRWS